MITEFVKDQVQNSIDDPGVNVDDGDHDDDVLMMNRIKSLDSGKIIVT